MMKLGELKLEGADEIRSRLMNQMIMERDLWLCRKRTASV